MATASTVLRTQQLVGSIAEYQHGVHEDMQPLLSALDPLEYVNIVFSGDESGIMKSLFASLDAAITGWYSEWGLDRLFKLFACAPQMQHRVIAHALWTGNLSVVTLLPVEMLRAVPSYVVTFAAFRNDITVLKYLHEVVGLDVSTPRAMYNAAQSGHLDVIRYLHELNNNTNVRLAVLIASLFGHLDVIEFFHTHCASCNLNSAFEVAISSHHWVVAECILGLVGKDNLDGPHAMTTMVNTNNVAGLEWLHRRGFGLTADLIERAAGSGRLEVVKWLYAHRSEGSTESAMHLAATHGHLKVVEWLVFNCHEGCTVDTLAETTYHGYWDVVRFLVSHGIDSDCAQVALAVALKKEGAPADVLALLQSAGGNSNEPPQKKQCYRHHE